MHTVVVESAGRSFRCPDTKSILVGVEHSGGDDLIQVGCRSGGCGSGETRLLEGRVQYEHTPDHDVAAGHCLLCVGRPATSLALDA